MINTQFNVIYNEPRTDQQRLQFLSDFDPDLLDWQCGRSMNRGDLCRMRGIASSSGMEPGTDSVLAGLEAVEDVFYDNGFGRDENGSIVKDGYGCVSLTQLAPKWKEITAQGMIRPTVYGDSHGRDNLLFGIGYPGTQFDDWSNRLFVEHMKRTFTAAEQHDLGFDARGFHIRDYLAQKRKTMNNEQLIEEPLLHEYIRFYYIEVLKINVQYAERVKRSVAQQGRPVPAFYGNCASAHNFRVVGVPICSLVDLAWIEDSSWLKQLPGVNEDLSWAGVEKGGMQAGTTLLYKVGRASMHFERPIWSCPHIHRKKNERLVNGLAAAEAHANGGVLFQDLDLETPDTAVWQTHRHHNQFANRNRCLFIDRTAPVDVAVVNSIPSLFWRWFSSLQVDKPHYRHLTAAARLLEDEHIPYEVLIFGHPDVFDDTRELARLDKYKMLVMPSVDCLSNRQVKAVSDWVRRGGRLVLWDEVGTRDEELKRRHEPAFARLMANPGRGSVVSTAAANPTGHVQSGREHDLAKAYLQRKPGADSQLATLLKLEKPLITTNLPKLVWLNVWDHGGGPMRSVQIVNYDFDPDSTDFSPVKDFTIRMRMPPGVEYTQADYLCTNYYTPEAAVPPPQQLPFDVADGYIEVTVPHLEIFGVVVFSTQGELEARETAAQTRKWYERLKIAKRCRGQSAADGADLLNRATAHLDKIQGDVKVCSFYSLIEPGTRLTSQLRRAVEKVTKQVTEGKNRLCEDVLAAQAVYKFDFGESEVADGWTPITTSTDYSPNRGYGWTSKKQLSAVDNGQPDSLHRDYIRSRDPVTYTEGELPFFRSPFPTHSEAEFRVDLPNGQYLVTVVTGEYNAYFHSLKTSTTAVDINGMPMLYGDRYYSGYYQNRACKATVSDRKLVLRFWGNGDGPLYFNNCEWLVNGLLIQRLDQEPTPLAADHLSHVAAGSATAIRNWHVIGPFDDDDCTGLDTTFPPEVDTDLRLAHQGKHGEVTWQQAPKLHGSAPYVSLTSLLHDTDEVAGFAVAKIHSDKAQRAVLTASTTQLGVGYVNGVEVFRDEIAAGLLPREEQVVIQLKKGLNTILIKSLNHWGDEWALRAGLAARNGQPLAGVKVLDESMTEHNGQ